MSSRNNNFIDKFYKDVMPIVTGLGAAVVIIGAMFKLLNLSGASVMLAVGLLTEASLFVLGAFEPKHKEFDWFEVYPELADTNGDYGVKSKGNLRTRVSDSGRSTSDEVAISLSSKLDEIFSKANIDASLISKLGDGMTKIADYAGNMASMVDVTQVSDRYCSSLLKASGTIEAMSASHDKVMNVLESISGVGVVGGQYNDKMNDILECLDMVELGYKKEAELVGKRLESMSVVYDSINRSVVDLSSVGTEATKFKDELTELSEKFESLNKIYGSMLSAFKV